MLADKEKTAENTLCILKGFDAVWGHFRPAEPRVPLSIDASLLSHKTDEHDVLPGSF